MSALKLKTQLREMIERETDLSVLEAIRIILQKTSLDPVLKEKLSSRALKSEGDIKANRIFNREEVAHRTNR
ncbi:MAG: hypothetical protein RIA63_07700 [Cyclobacteriaceae bacterium]